MKKAIWTKLLAIILVLTMVLFFSGCWNRRELDDLGIIGAVAFDSTEEKVKLIFEIIKPQQKKSDSERGSQEIIYVESTGDTFFDAIRNATLKFDRKLFWPHTKVYIFSEAFARKGLATEYIDYFQRDHETRMNVYLVVARNNPVSEIIGISGGIEKIPSDYLEGLLKAQKANSKAVAVRLRDFLRIYYDEGIQPVMGVVQAIQKVKTGVNSENGGTKYEIKDEGSAVFLEGKMIGFLDGIETRALNFVTGEVKSGIIVSDAPEGDGVTSIEIIRADSNNEVFIEGDQVRIKVKVNIEGMLGEEWANIDVSNPEILEKIALANSNVLKSQIEDVIEKVQKEYRADVFGFGRIVRKKSLVEWERMKDNWEDILSTAEVTVEVKTEINRIGLVSKTARRER